MSESEYRHIKATVIREGQYFRGVIMADTDEVIHICVRRYQSSKKAHKNAHSLVIRTFYTLKKMGHDANFEILDAKP